jgi:hypothetical protein
MGWRDKYKVHPSADVFPMMPDDELDALAADIKANGLREPIAFWDVNKGTPQFERLLCDGRNRMEAMERAGIPVLSNHKTFIKGDPVAYIISKNIHRRHLSSKEQQADLIVAAHKADKPVQAEPVSKGGRGHKNALKAAVIADAKKAGISESTAKRSLAKAEGRKPKKKKELPIPKAPN